MTTRAKPRAGRSASQIALGLWTALPQFRGDASERTWVYRVAHNTALVSRRASNAGRNGNGLVHFPICQLSR